VLKSRQQELTNSDAAILEYRGPDEKCLRAGAASKPRRLEVEEAEFRCVGTWIATWPGTTEHVQRIQATFERVDHVADTRTAVHPIGGVVAVDDEDGAFARFDPLASKDVSEVVAVNSVSRRRGGPSQGRLR
jgi:hypothetical protein